MNADHFFRSAGWLIIGVCFTLVLMSLGNRSWMSKECDALNPEVIVHHFSQNTTADALHLPSLSGGKVCEPASFMPTFRDASELGRVLHQLELRTGAELEVKDGNFSRLFLNEWRTATEYVLVNVWERANTAEENPWKLEALSKVNAAIGAGHLKKYGTCQNHAIACAGSYPDAHFDFIFLDLQKPETTEDVLKAWWPKLRPKGIVSGHDYTGENVDGFFSDKTGHMQGCPRQVVVSYGSSLPSLWAVRK